MKPLFGGSDRRYRLLQERGRQLTELESDRRSGNGSGGVGGRIGSGGFVYSSNGYHSVYSMGSVDSSSDVSMVGIADTSGKTNRASGSGKGSLRPPYMNRSYGSTDQSGLHVAPLTHPNNTTSTINSTNNHPTLTPHPSTSFYNTTNANNNTNNNTNNHTINNTHPTHTTHTTHSALSTPITDSFWSPGGREYVLEEDREDELELEKLAEEICLLDRDNE